jgi:AGZA family xanthine/uracil permease-like MFS transporter
MNAVPLSLMRAIGAGIGLFILFIGFNNGGLIGSTGNTPAEGPPLVPLLPTSAAQFVFLFGLLLTAVLWARKIKAALIISILATTLLALVANVATVPTEFSWVPSFSTLGAFDVGNVFAVLPLLTAVLVIFSIMLVDFFDTMGTVTGVASEAGLTRDDGSVPNVGRVLLVDSVAAAVGGLGGVSSNTTYIESAAGVAEGARTGFASVVTGALFLLAIVLAPLAGIIPGVATAPALVLVGFLMFTQVRDIDVANFEDGFPALLTIILMPVTFEISPAIGAGFITWVVIKLARGKVADIHPLMWLVSIAFLIFFLQSWIEPYLPG